VPNNYQRCRVMMELVRHTDLQNPTPGIYVSFRSRGRLRCPRRCAPGKALCFIHQEIDDKHKGTGYGERWGALIFMD
jgi:hypothetical protein